jgi:hypothetical protein
MFMTLRFDLYAPKYQSIQLARLVAPGGFIIYQHFVDGVQDSAVGRPNQPHVWPAGGDSRSCHCDETRISMKLCSGLMKPSMLSCSNILSTARQGASSAKSTLLIV